MADNETDAAASENPGTSAVPESPDSPLASPDELQQLELIRGLLLRVHRALLAVERARYEKVRGRIENNSAFLQLVIADPWFDWLRPMAQLVLLIDERASDKASPIRSAEARSLMERSKTLLQADSEGDAFQRLFYQAVQSSPDLAVMARQVATALKRR